MKKTRSVGRTFHNFHLLQILPDLLHFKRLLNKIKLHIVKSEQSGKKYTAIFEHEGHTKRVSFGAAGMDDYTKTHDVEQRRRYRLRHKKDLTTGDPMRAGFLSYYILWGNSTSMQTNLQEYKRKFHFE